MLCNGKMYEKDDAVVREELSGVRLHAAGQYCHPSPTEYKDAWQPRCRESASHRLTIPFPTSTTSTSFTMKYTLAFAGLVAGALAGECAAPAPAPTSYETTSDTPVDNIPASDTAYFTVISSRSASPIHLLPLTARGGKFYLGGTPSSYCPESVGAGCPKGDSTTFVGGDKTLSLGVVVPGGQSVYVAKDGSLSYTIAHSGVVPEGSIADQFSKTAPTEGNVVGYLNFETGFVACPSATDSSYQVFGQTDGFKAAAECLGFNALTSKSTHIHLLV